jgi:N-acetylglutamate synthase-like GNAT family acetyltransferase
MKIRKAKESDKEEVIKLVRKLYGRSAPRMVEKRKRDFYREKRKILVVEVNGKVIAYLAYYFDQYSLKVSDLYVLLKYRKKGIAIKLLKKAENLKKTHKKKYLRVDVRKKDKPAARLYEKFGFEVWMPKGRRALKLRK